MSDSTPTTPASANIGVVGLAVMGSNLARNLASREGNTVAIFNRSPEKTRDLAATHPEAGFVATESYAEFAAALSTPRTAIITKAPAASPPASSSSPTTTTACSQPTGTVLFANDLFANYLFANDLSPTAFSPATFSQTTFSPATFSRLTCILYRQIHQSRGIR